MSLMKTRLKTAWTGSDLPVASVHIRVDWFSSGLWGKCVQRAPYSEQLVLLVLHSFSFVLFYFCFCYIHYTYRGNDVYIISVYIYSIYIYIYIILVYNFGFCYFCYISVV